MPHQEVLELKASDGIAVAARRWRHSGKKRPLIIVAPGFSQNKDTPIMRRCCDILAELGDLLCVDFRGTGHSGGRYHFGSEEQLDLEAAFKWAKPRYPEIELIGFSMGAYISLRAAVEFPGYVKRLYFVSGPTDINGIVKTLGPIRQAVTLFFKPDVLKLRLWAGSDYFFRWGTLFSKKPSGLDLAAAIKIPVSFLIGKRDQLVLPSLSRRVYEAVQTKKLWTEFPRGHHAEYLAVMQTDDFKAWFLKSRAAFSGAKRSRA